MILLNGKTEKNGNKNWCFDYAELRSKTNFSFLRGASHPHELVERAVELGMRALAITDDDGVYGLPKAYLAAKEHPQFQLISGADLQLEGQGRVSLLAQTRQGYGVLCRMLTAAFEGKQKGEAELAWRRFLQLMQRPGAQELVAIPRLSANWESFKELFSQGRLYIPVSRFLDGCDRKRIQEALLLSRRLGLEIVAMNEVHYHHPERRVLQDVLTGIREGETLDRLGSRIFSNSERYLKSPQEMTRLFQDLPQAIRNTVKIAESCSFQLNELRYQYPSEWIPEGETAQSFLEQLIEEGVRWRYPEGPSEAVRKQLKYELKLIEELRFADYFLTIWDVVKYARDRDILCQGRGSAANSIVCYVLGITSVDPVRMELLFERFISAERGEPPDIDVDFEHERREEVIQHVYEKYGRDRAAMLSAVVTYRSRSAIREVSKVLGREIDRLELDQAPVDQEVSIKKEKEEAADLKEKKFYSMVRALYRELKGFPRHLSIHSGGFILSADAVIETVPVEPARMEGRTIIQWDKYDLDALGLLKVDLLSLGMLTAVQKCLKLVGKWTFSQLPQEDPATYQMMQKADTVGVFQIESRAQMNMLGRLKPENFYDLVIEIAIVRPGPIVGKMVHPYLKRRRGIEPVTYPHPNLEEILSKTLGVPLFQEQVMKIAIAMAGFSAGEADYLRKAIGAWRSSGSIENIGTRLMQGLIQNGISEAFAQRVFDQIKGFAQYGFPESHSASFALIAYASSFLKCHYPAEFCCALVNSQPLGFYANHSLIDDAKRHGVKVLPVDPNRSEWDCLMVEKNTILLGWRVMKGLGRKEAERLIEERKKGPYQGLVDFLSRVIPIGIRQNQLETMALGDVFRSFGWDQRHALWEILAYDPQLSLFSRVPSQSLDQSVARSLAPQVFPGLDRYEKIQADYESFGLSVREHPMAALREKLPRLPPLTSARVKQLVHGDRVNVSGLVIIRQRPQTAKGTCFATLEDEEGFLDLILHKAIFEKFKEMFLSHAFLVARGVVQKDGYSVSLLVRELFPLPGASRKRVFKQSLRLPQNYPVRPGGW